MRKFLACLTMIGLLASGSLALPSGILPYGVSAKYAAMGGAGASLVDDIASAYYNPAGMYRSGGADLKIGAGTASDGSDQLVSMASNLGNPAKFLSDNFSKSLDINGNVHAIIGLSVGKFGLSVIPAGRLNLSKAANTLNGTISGLGHSDTALTFGYGVGIPYLAKAGVGASVKYIHNALAGAAVTASGATTTITNTITQYNGLGFDLGLQGTLDLIPTAPISVALVYKDFAANLNGTQQISSGTFNTLTGAEITPMATVSDGPIAGTSIPTTLVLGASGQIPIVGLKLAVDLDTIGGNTPYSVTHIGLEYPVAMGLVNLRLGKINGSNVDMFTYGAGILKDMVNIAFVSDNKDSRNNQMLADIHIGF
ncbi:MAG: hypothetical protein WC490_03085 [Candidatus Margulisiibacteriota bacterium]